MERYNILFSLLHHCLHSHPQRALSYCHHRQFESLLQPRSAFLGQQISLLGVPVVEQLGVDALQKAVRSSREPLAHPNQRTQVLDVRRTDPHSGSRPIRSNSRKWVEFILNSSLSDLIPEGCYKKRQGYGRGYLDRGSQCPKVTSQEV